MESKRLSVVIIAKDEEENIGNCLESVKWAEEIVVVVDDRTTDKTAQIAKKYTPKVYINKFRNFGQQCQYALEKATGDWILKLDADERITPELKKEILKKIKSQKLNGYHAYFRPVFLGREFTKSNVRIQGTIRLIRRGKGKFAPVGIHEKIEVEGKIGVLDKEILHYSQRTIAQTLEKFNYFSSLEAEELFRAGGRTNLLFMILAPLHIFLRRFFLEKNYREGMYGFIYSLVYAHYYLAKHLKIWELTRGKENED